MRVVITTLTAVMWCTRIALGDPVPGQLDDFEDGTTMGWSEGTGGIGGNPSPPTNAPDGGPLGEGDHFVQNISAGFIGEGSRQIMFNLDPRWTGDYSAAGLTGIQLQMANLGDNPTSMRIAISNLSGQAGSSNAYASNTPFELPADGVWRSALFEFSDLVPVEVPFATLNEVLTSVAQLRIMHAPAGPTWNSTDAVAATVGYDNFEAVAQLLQLGDANNDNQVTGLDLITVQQNFGEVEQGAPTGTLLGDADDDGQVTGLDLITVQQNFGKALAPAVPEPTTLAVLGACCLGACRSSGRPM